MSAVPELCGVKVTWQLAESVVGLDKVQLLEPNEPVADPKAEKLTDPIGGDGLGSVSVTVTVQSDPWLTTTVAGEHDTVVVVL